MKTKAILFDFDGTLANTTKGILATMTEVFRRMGTAVPSDDAMAHTIGLPLFNALKQLGNYSDEDAQKAVDLYRDLFMEFEVCNISIFPEVVETLENLRSMGIRMAVVTSRDAFSLELILKNNRIDGFFESCITNNDKLPRKPAPDMVLTMLKRLDITADEAIVVGDTIYDIEMGNSAGCRTIAVTYGNHSRELLSKSSPTCIIDSFGEIQTYNF